MQDARPGSGHDAVAYGARPRFGLATAVQPQPRVPRPLQDPPSPNFVICRNDISSRLRSASVSAPSRIWHDLHQQPFVIPHAAWGIILSLV